jgi:hypothetical protein
MRALPVLLAALLAPAAAVPDLAQIADAQRWTLLNADVHPTVEQQRPVLLMEPSGAATASQAGSNVGLALVGGLDFSEGTIEVDLRGNGEAEASFLGVAFDVADDKTFEAIYFRPFNFKREGDGYRAHAVQYVSWPEHTWEKLRQGHPGVYEATVSPVPDPSGWFHARVEVTRRTVRVWVDDGRAPSLVVDRLGTRARGRVGLWVDSKRGAFRNLRVSARAR